MDAVVAVLLSVMVGYGLGSLPWAYLVARWRGVDIHAIGTGIAGAANVFRKVGHREGILVFAADAGKGAAAVVFAHLAGADGSLALPALAAAVVGHRVPALGRWPGGAGLATMSGGAVVLGGWVGLAAMVIGVAMVAVLRNTGNGAGLGFAAYLVLGVLFGMEWGVLAGVLALAIAVLAAARFRHGRRTTLR